MRSEATRDEQFRNALAAGRTEARLSLADLAEMAGVNQRHLGWVLTGERGVPRPSTRRRLASALASTGLVSEEVIETVAGGERLDLDILVDRTKAGDLYRACVFHPDAGRRLRVMARMYLADEYAQLPQGDDRNRLLEWILLWLQATFYGMGSRRRAEAARNELRNGLATPTEFSDWLDRQEEPLAAMALVLAAVTWWNMALAHPLLRTRPVYYVRLLDYREQLPPEVAAVLSEAIGQHSVAGSRRMKAG